MSNAHEFEVQSEKQDSDARDNKVTDAATGFRHFVASHEHEEPVGTTQYALRAQRKNVGSCVMAIHENTERRK